MEKKQKKARKRGTCACSRVRYMNPREGLKEENNTETRHVRMLTRTPELKESLPGGGGTAQRARPLLETFVESFLRE